MLEALWFAHCACLQNRMGIHQLGPRKCLVKSKWLFKDVPARREEFTKVTGSMSFPLDFCSYRWLENVEVAEHALQILPSLKTDISAAKAKKKKKIREPSTKSFKKAEVIVHHDLFPAKLNFFLIVAREVTPFLKLYQTDKPMLPFMCNDLTILLRSLLEKFDDDCTQHS